MTIPFSIPFGNRRLVMSFHLMPAAPAAPPAPTQAHRGPDLSAAYDATDAELARLNARSAAAEDRRRWESQAVLLGLTTR